MIIFDTETTGLVQPATVPLTQQPQIIEFAAIKVDSKLKVIDRLEFKCNPGRPLPEIITKITGITDADLKNEKPFSHYYMDVANLFLGERAALAHNFPFDRDLLTFELRRINKGRNFPWPIQHICTVELTRHITGKFMKLTALYEHAFGKKLDQKHRAMDDVEDLLEVCKWLKKQGILEVP